MGFYTILIGQNSGVILACCLLHFRILKNIFVWKAYNRFFNVKFPLGQFTPYSQYVCRNELYVFVLGGNVQYVFVDKTSGADSI